MYVLTNGSQYVAKNKGKYFLTSKKSSAARFNTQSDASKTLCNIPRKWHILNLKCVSDQKEKENTISIGDEQSLVHEYVSDFIKSKDMRDQEEKVKELRQEIDEFISKSNSLRKQCEKARDSMAESLSCLDMAKQDLEHKVEDLCRQNKLNGVIGFRYGKEIGEVRCARRFVKDNLFYLSRVLEFIPNPNSDGYAKLKKQFESYTENPVYKPRMLKNIF